jgi:hypothetical protein
VKCLGIGHRQILTHICDMRVGGEHDANLAHRIAANRKVLRLETVH